MPMIRGGRDHRLPRWPAQRRAPRTIRSRTRRHRCRPGLSLRYRERRRRNRGTSCVRDRLRLLLDDSNWVYRRQAIELLGLLEDESVVSDLANMLEDPNEEVRWQAASSLRAFSAQAIVPPLLRALRDPAWAVRARAAEALGHMRALDALPSLRPLFISSMPRERADATYALILMEVERGSTMLLPLLDDPDERVSDSARLAIEVLE